MMCERSERQVLGSILRAQYPAPLDLAPLHAKDGDDVKGREEGCYCCRCSYSYRRRRH